MIARKGLTYNDIFLSPIPMRRPFGQWHDRKLSKHTRLVSPWWLSHKPELTVTAVTRKGICGCYVGILRASFRLPSSKRAAGMPLKTSQVQSASRKRGLEQSLHACLLITCLPFYPFRFSVSLNSLHFSCPHRESALIATIFHISDCAGLRILHSASVGCQPCFLSWRLLLIFWFYLLFVVP